VSFGILFIFVTLRALSWSESKWRGQYSHRIPALFHMPVTISTAGVAQGPPRSQTTNLGWIAAHPASFENQTIFHLLLQQFGTRIKYMAKKPQPGPACKWRFVVQSWLRCQGLIVINGGKVNRHPAITFLTP